VDQHVIGNADGCANQIRDRRTADDHFLSVPLSALSGGIYQYTINSLKADTTYSFWTRCGDQLTWSRWSDQALKIKTTPTTLVELVLKPADDPSGSGVVVGSADLSQTSRNWSAPARIPPATPEGVYNLIAALPAGGSAATTIRVANIVQPSLLIPDPATGAPTPSPVWLTVGSAFTVKGVNFPTGVASLSLDGTFVGDFTVVSTGEFLAPLTAPESFGAHTIEATVGSTSASFTFTTMAQPK
jgi:hypothetical protein